MPRKIASPFSALIFLAWCILFALNMQSVRVRCSVAPPFTLFPTLDHRLLVRSSPSPPFLSLPPFAEQRTPSSQGFSFPCIPSGFSARRNSINNGKENGQVQIALYGNCLDRCRLPFAFCLSRPFLVSLFLSPVRSAGEILRWNDRRRGSPSLSTCSFIFTVSSSLFFFFFSVPFLFDEVDDFELLENYWSRTERTFRGKLHANWKRGRCIYLILLPFKRI